ncbi:hypothetical protein CPA50_17125 [Marinobacter sp. ANT_B65]|nr:hypothetical protein CPA50_17125 [Marinobacter sp. ANT_B65]
MQSSPSAIELLESVTAFLRNDAIPKLSGREAFDARVAANVLDIVERELRLAPKTDAAERDSLTRLPGIREDTFEVMNRQLCEKLASGQYGFDTPGLIDHLWMITLNRLSIDQPGYSSYHAAIHNRSQP